MRRLIAFLLVCVSAQAGDHGDSLVPLSDATHVADQSGSWQAAETWGEEGIPDDGARVVIPKGIMVENDGQTADVLWIRVDGTLSCCRTCTTQINVHTLWGGPGSRMDFRCSAPGAGNCTIEWLPGSYLPGDWQQLSRGLITCGELTISGKPKTAWSVLAADTIVPPDATTLTLVEPPLGWDVGDRIILAGTDSTYAPGRNRYQSEDLTITGIDGNTVSFTPPAKYRHRPWRPDLKVHVANLTRSVRFRSRQPDTIENRGHIMVTYPAEHVFMPGDVRWCEFREMGRTNKLQAVTDPRLDPVTMEPVPESDRNPRARYAGAHNHRTGPMQEPTRYVGVVVDGSPGWGCVNHDSHMEFTECIAVRCNGSGFATEEGQERGFFRRCLAALCIGQGETIRSTDEDHGQASNANWGTDGSGFWLQGGMVDVIDCVAFDCSGRGFASFNVAYNDYPQNRPSALPDYLWYPIVVDAPALTERFGDAFDGQPADSGRVPFRHFERNTAYNCKVGVQCWSAIFDKRPLNMPSLFKDTTCWGRGAIFHAEYLRDGLIDGLTVVGDLHSTGGFRSESSSITKSHGGCMVRFIPQSSVTRYDWSGTIVKFQQP